MPREARISARIDPQLKKQANAVLKRLGIKPSQAITMLYSQIAENKGLPFDVKIPNAETSLALGEDVHEKPRLSSVKSVIDELNK